MLRIIMHNQVSEVEQLSFRYLWFLILSYCMAVVLANWFDPRLIRIVGLNTDAGTLVFPLTFLLSDLITEVYGFKYARRAIWCGFLFNVFFIVYGQIIIRLPSPDYATHNEMFDALFAMNIRIIIASITSYLIAEPLNSMVMAKLKIKTKGKYMSLRFISSTVVASGLDSMIFASIAFSGVMNNLDLVCFIFTMWTIKMFIEVLGLPFSIRIAKKLKTLEKVDRYDNETQFNIFSLNVGYAAKSNFYK